MGYVARMEGGVKRLSVWSIHVIAALCLGGILGAHAYNEGGHYYTVLALLDSLAGTGTPEEQLKEMKLQAYCSQLPDLGRELDAIAQRVRVLESVKDWGWGGGGSCQTRVSSHMVSSQYYLHGLSGVSPERLRAAASRILQAIDDELPSLAPGTQARRNLVCARGFAAHLYGDAFAHVKLSSEDPSLFARTFSGLFSREIVPKMYGTGLGHARSGHAPDYLYGHRVEENKWPRWVEEAATTVVPGSNAQRVKASQTSCGGSIKSCEEPMRKLLEGLVQRQKELLIPNMQQLIATGNKGIGGMERATSCEKVVNDVFAAGDRPQCEGSWQIYLDKAVRAFFSEGIDPTARPNATANYNCSAWRCAGRKKYRGESPNPSTCPVYVTDRLSFGLD